jgi:hypothetical protein
MTLVYVLLPFLYHITIFRGKVREFPSDISIVFPMTPPHCIGNDNVLMSEIEKHTRNLLFQLHVARLNVIRDQSQD